MALALVFAAQVGIFGFLAWVSYERTIAHEEATLAVDAQATAEQIAQAMRLVDVQLQHLEDEVLQNIQWTEELDRDALAVLGAAASSAPHIGGAGYTDSAGTVRGVVLSDGSTMLSGLDISKRPYFTAHRDGQIRGTYLSEPVEGRLRGRRILLTSRRLSSPEGDFLGTVMMSVLPSYFAEQFAHGNELPIQRRIVTAAGTLVAVARPADDGGATSDQEPQLAGLTAGLMSQAEVFTETNTAGDEVLTAVAPVPGWPLVATASLGRGAILADWLMALLAIGIALALSLAAMVVMVRLLHEREDFGRKQEHRFRSLIEDAIDGVIIHDLGIVLFANDAAAQMIGLYHGTELRGRSLAEFVHGDAQARTLEQWRHVKESGQSRTARRVPARRVDGKMIYADMSSQQIEWGDRTAIRSSLNEVTDQVLLARKDQRRTAILAAVNDAHSIYLNQTRNRLAFEELLEKILDLSGSVYGLIAEKLEDEEGKPYLRTLAISNIAWDDETRRWYESAATGGMEFRNTDNLRGVPLRTGEVLIANNPRRHPASTGVPCGHLAMDNVMILPLTLEDEILGEVALANRKGGFDDQLASELAPIVQAITRIVSDFRTDRLREAAERASESKSAFLAHMSHELRTPLSGVIANLELLSEDKLEREQSDLVEASMTAGKALLGIIGNTLDFSKIEADELVLDMTEFDPAVMVEDVQSIFFAAARDKGLTLSTAVDARVPRTIRADEMRLRQVLSNLVGNAIKFTAKGRIAISLFADRLDDATAQLCFSVDDTGIGFDPEQAENLFKPFGQESGSTARNFGGTGLGLTIAQRLVALHGGDVKCFAQPEAGSSFVAFLPATVVDWGDPEVWSLENHSICLLFPEGDLPEGLVPDLLAAGAEVQCVAEARELMGTHCDDTHRRRSLFVDWDALDPEQEAVIEGYKAGYSRVFALTSDNQADRRRRALFHHGVILAAKPLSAVSASHAILGDDKARSQRLAEEASADQGGYQVFEPGQAPKILIVEDQPMNQLVLRRQLRRLGADCDLAEHGREALDLLDQRSYDLVITDCSMPVMDGFELSTAIRGLEAAGRPRSVIIALTANAVTGDAQRCYDAGMDAYLSKPVGLSELSRALEQWWNPAPQRAQAEQAPEESETAPAEAAAGGPPIDRQGLAELIGEDDDETIDALILEFFENWQQALAGVHGPWQRREAVALRAAAHAAKGTARYGMAPVLAEICQDLEHQAEDADWDRLQGLIDGLDTETERLRAHLQAGGLIGEGERRSA
ncbi:ATP-binding protein [Pelagibius sp.]|uniref:ATP-binding protein n=1 Tax=Pelagibius sp. TaxID=1931238 RepID=UPI00260A3528|nr:ATP-binding protein [Pelagibius sp.]